tara:strand:- start:206 stop:547 length:342 start_codon:yes stop_codon:yes gene_type:complete
VINTGERVTHNNKENMEDIFKLIAEVGAPIAGSLVMGFFIFLVIKQIMEGIVDQVKTLTGFCKMLEARASTMSNEMMKIDLLVSSALELKPDIERIARAENFVEDGKVDARRD